MLPLPPAPDLPSAEQFRKHTARFPGLGVSRWFRSDALRKVDRSLESYSTVRAAYEKLRRELPAPTGASAAAPPAASEAAKGALSKLSKALWAVRGEFIRWSYPQGYLDDPQPGLLRSLQFGRHRRNALTTLRDKIEEDCKYIHAMRRWHCEELEVGDKFTHETVNLALLSRAEANAQQSLPQQREPHGPAVSSIERSLATAASAAHATSVADAKLAATARRHRR